MLPEPLIVISDSGMDANQRRELLPASRRPFIYYKVFPYTNPRVRHATVYLTLNVSYRFLELCSKCNNSPKDHRISRGLRLSYKDLSSNPFSAEEAAIST